MNNNDTLHGGRKVNVTLLDGSKAEFTARQLPLGDWDKGLELFFDKLALTAFIFGHEKDWLASIQPADFKLLKRTAEEVNAEGFFDFAPAEAEAMRHRLLEKEAKQILALSELSPETIKLVMQEGASLSLPSRAKPRSR